jgi:hypothetical protein
LRHGNFLISGIIFNREKTVAEPGLRSSTRAPGLDDSKEAAIGA